MTAHPAKAAGRPRAVERLLHIVNLGGYLLGLLVIVAVLNVFAQRPALRAQIDATKTRTYSLSDQTIGLLEGLQGEWSISLVMIEGDTDRTVRRQIDEVLKRLTRATPNLTVARIDPTDPGSLHEYETLLARLRSIYGTLIERYDQTLDRGVAAFGELQVFAQQRAGGLIQLAGTLPESIDPATREGLERRAQLMALLADQGDKVIGEVARVRQVTEAQPIPDYDAARSTLAVALDQWARELDDVARLLEVLLEKTELDPEMRRLLRPVGREYDRTAQTLAAAADPLRQLPALELAEIGRRLREGEAAIVLGPERAAVIPSSQLFPRTFHAGEGDRPITFDQRFRGEQIIASTIRSLQKTRLPMVVFVHAEPQSMLNRRDADVDLAGAATMLAVSRLDVREWIVQQSEQPLPAADQPAVWVVMPPLQRRGLEPGPGERRLLEVTRRLLADGEPVLLSVYPSHWARFKRADPWVEVVRPFGLTIDTARVVMERRRVSEEAQEILTAHPVQRYPEAHAIGRAVQGLGSTFPFPVRIDPLAETPDAVTHAPLVEIAASDERWLEPDWNRRPELIMAPGDPADRLAETVAIAMAAERPSPVTRSRQRLVLVGSGGWMLSRVADVAVGVGGDRFALLNPGNVEMLLTSVYWLAGLDDLIAPGPASREVARLADLSRGAQRGWFWISVALCPAVCLGLGMAVWVRRRS